MTAQTHTHSLLEHALAYLQQGWRLVMMPSGTKGPTHEGWNAPSELVSTPEQVIIRLQHGPQNMGLVHQPSGTCAIDIDDAESARFIFDELGIDYDDLVGRGMRVRSKANRDKVIFAAPDMPLIKIAWPRKDSIKANDRVSLFELRSGPNQDVLPPSIHPDGHHYEWYQGRAPWDFDELPKLPEPVAQLWAELADRNSKTRQAVQEMCPWRVIPIGGRPMVRPRAVQGAHNNVIGQYNAAHDIHSTLEAAGYKRKGRRYLCPTSSGVIPGVVVLDGDKAFSHHGSDVLADGYAHDSFGVYTLVEHGGDVSAAIKAAAAELGIDRNEPAESPAIAADVLAILATDKARKSAAATAAPPDERPPASPPVQASMPLPPNLLDPPGAMGEFVEWVLRSSPRPNRELAVAAAIPFFGALLGRKVATHTRARTNLYIVGVADTGQGKDAARQAIKRLLRLTDRLSMVGEDVASGGAVASFVHGSPAGLLLPDEFGQLLKATSAKGAAPHLADIVTMLMKLYTSTGEVYIGKQYADSKTRPRQDIPFPCLSLYSTTTPGEFWDAMSGRDAVSGWLNRLLVVPVTCGHIPMRQVAASDPPPTLVDWVKRSSSMSIGTAGIDPDNPIIVAPDSMAEQYLARWLAEVEATGAKAFADGDEYGKALWQRVYEMTIKLAVIVATASVKPHDLPQSGSAGAESIEVNVSHAQWAVQYVRHYVLQMGRDLVARVSESEADRVVKDVKRALDEASPNPLTSRDIQRRCQRTYGALGDKAKRLAVLATLEHQGDCFTRTARNARGLVVTYYFSMHALDSVTAAEGDSVTVIADGVSG